VEELQRGKFFKKLRQVQYVKLFSKYVYLASPHAYYDSLFLLIILGAEDDLKKVTNIAYKQVQLNCWIV
jgi:hypothetical protein